MCIFMIAGQQKHSRFLVVDYKADEVSVVRRSVALPGELYSSAVCVVVLELQDITLTLRQEDLY